MQHADIPLTHIFTRADARKIDEEAVRGLVNSIREIGIINPLRVRSVERHVEGVPAEAFEVTAGSHRLRAARKLMLETVPCVVIDDDDLHAELAMIDENLMRAELGPAEKAASTKRREAIYLELHPDAGHGGDRRSDQVANFATRSESFADSTAGSTGVSARTVRLNAERGEKIVPEALEMVSGTALNTGAYLDKLKRMSVKDQVAAVVRDLAAGRQSQRKPVPPSDAPRNDFEVINSDHRALVRAWEAARPEAREQFLADIGAVIDVPVMDQQ